MALQGAVLTCTINQEPSPIPLEELPVLLFEGHFTPEEEAQTLRAAEWLVKERLLERDGDQLSPAPASHRPGTREVGAESPTI